MKKTKRFALLLLLMSLLTLSLASCSDGGNIRDDTESGQIDMVPNHPSTDATDTADDDRTPTTTNDADAPNENATAARRDMNDR